MIVIDHFHVCYFLKKVSLGLWVIRKYNPHLHCSLYEACLRTEGSKVESLFSICFIVYKTKTAAEFEKRKYSCCVRAGLYEQRRDLD